MSALKSAINKVDTAKDIIEEVVSGFPKFEEIKDQIKAEKLAIQDSRAKLGHEISQLSMLLKRTDDKAGIPKLVRTLEKMSVTYDEFNSRSEILDKKLAQLDIAMSKTQMVISAGEQKINQVDSNFERQQLSFSDQEVNILHKLNNGSQANHTRLEEEIVASLQKIFKGTKENFGLFSEIRSQSLESTAPQIEVEYAEETSTPYGASFESQA